MPRTFFSRVLIQNLIILLAFLLVGGLLLDNFLTAGEIKRLGDQAGRLALMLKEEAARVKSEEELQTLVKNLGDSTKVRFTVIEKSGRVLADSLLDPAAMENHYDHPEVAAALGGQEARTLRKSQSVGIEMLYAALPGDPVVRAALPVSEVEAVINEVQKRILLALIPALVLAFLLSYLLARSMNLRIEKMRRFSSALEEGDYAVTLKPEGDDELSDMERSLMALRDEIKSKVSTLEEDAKVLSGLVEGFPHAVLLIDGARRLSIANSHARTLFKMENRPASGLPVSELVRNPKILAAIDETVKTAGSAEPARLLLGEPERQYELFISPLLGGDPKGGLVVILRDITKEAYLERARSDFIINLSHELRTPLTAIRGSAETLLESGGHDQAVLTRFLETIKRNSLRLETLLRDVSDLARAENSIDESEITTLEAALPLKNSVELFKGEAQKAGIELEIALPGEPALLTSDEGKIEQILINLLQNAVRYTPEGGKVKASVIKTAESVIYEISDTGIGIPEADMARVTERFYRVDPGRSRSVGGTGLGLSIVKHLVERLKATMTIKSGVGKGTTVRIEFPAG